jgi:HEAT repeat protein
MALFTLDMRKKVAKLREKKNVRGLIKALSYQDSWAVRDDAAEALGDILDVQAVEPLIATLKDIHRDVRRHAAEALGKIGDIRAVEPLIATLKDQESVVRKVAQEALVKLGRASIELVAAGLNHKDRDVQALVVEALVQTGDIRAVEPLVVYVKQGNWAAARALGEIGDSRAVEPLILTLKHEDRELREEAVQALGKIGDVRAVEPLIGALRDKVWRVRDYAADALGKIGDVRAVEPLIDALRDEEVAVRGDAADALGKIGDVRAVEPLIGALRDKEFFVRSDSWLRKDFADALRNLYHANTVDDVVKQKILAAHQDMPKDHTDKHSDVPGVCMFQHGDRHSDYNTEVPL